MNRFETHVFATVRVKVAGTNFSTDPQIVAEAVSNAVCASPAEWMRPYNGCVDIDGHGQHDIVEVEFADAITSIMVDELDESDRVTREHLFDANCRRTELAFNRQNALQDAYQELLGHPEAQVGNSKVHFALMRLKSLVPEALVSATPTSLPEHPASPEPQKDADCQSDAADEDPAVRREAIRFLKQQAVEPNANGYFSVPYWIDEQTCSHTVFDDAVDAAQFLKAELLKRGELEQYRVSLQDSGGRATVHFDCAATDADDAVEQAEAVYPGCHILLTTLLDTPAKDLSSADR